MSRLTSQNAGGILIASSLLLQLVLLQSSEGFVPQPQPHSSKSSTLFFNNYLDKLGDEQAKSFSPAGSGSYLDNLNYNHQSVIDNTFENTDEPKSWSPSGTDPYYDMSTAVMEEQVEQQKEELTAVNEEAKVAQVEYVSSFGDSNNNGQSMWDNPMIKKPSSSNTQNDAAITVESTTVSTDTTAPATPAMNVEKDFVSAQSTTTSTESSSSTSGTTQEDDSDRYLKMVSSEVQYKKLLGQNPYALTDVPVDVMMDRFLDVVEDVLQKTNGKTKGMSKLKGKKKPKDERPTVVVLGTGWAAHAFIKAASTYDLRIVVVSPVNHFVFTPMLASAAVGTIEYRSMTEPIRVTNPKIDNFVEGRAVGVDVQKKTVKVQLSSLSTVKGTFKGTASHAPDRLETGEADASSEIELTYDHLVCSVGTSVRSSMVPGAKENCFNLKCTQDSKRLRTAIGEALEYASRPDVQEDYYPNNPEMQQKAREERQRRVRFFIVGGGPTGVELAGEMADFFRQVCREGDGAYQHLAEDISITLVHGGKEVLPAMDTELRQKAMKSLDNQGVELRLNTRLKEVGSDFVKLGEKGSDEVETIPVGLTVWAAGNAPVPFVQELLSQLPESATGSAGRINVDRWLRAPTPTPDLFGSVIVLGDVADMQIATKFDKNPASLPQTAQVAGQQGTFLARLLNRGYDMTVTPPVLPEQDPYADYSLLRTWLMSRGLEEAPEFVFLNLGLLAYIGGGEALNQVKLGEVPIFNYSGRIAFLLWKTVYLAKQAATRNQALISFDWLRTELFGRDITRL